MYISILMPIYNGIEFLSESLNSIQNQTYENWELIIGINGHPENSEVYQIAKEFESDKIHVYDLHTISGKSNTLNHMLTLAKYDRIALLDVDDYWLPKKLEKQVTILNIFDFDVIGTNCRYFGVLNSLPNIPLGVINTNILKNTNPIINSSAIIKKELCYWNPEYESVEDYELWIYLAKENKSFYNVPEILTMHRIHPQSAFNSNNKQTMLVDKLRKSF